MADDTIDPSGPIDPVDPASMPADFDANAPADPNDEIPVPTAMWPSEVDERAQVVEALRGNGPPPRTDSQVDPA
jgi:hypothetical protein